MMVTTVRGRPTAVAGPAVAGPGIAGETVGAVVVAVETAVAA
jgi:hypothetical protein